MASLRENGQKINVQNSKVPGKSCKRPLRKTRCDHNAANPEFSLEILAAYFFKYICPKTI
jgi:hypothetical protein